MKLEHKSLDRGITILEILTRSSSCSLAELHAASGISKSSIRRLLATLVERRLVRRSLADGRYRSSISMHVGAGVRIPAHLEFELDVALPRVMALTSDISWPSDIHLLDGDRMRVLDSTRPLSPFHLYRGVVDHSVNIFGSAAGMACLAALPDSTFEQIAAHTAGDQVWGLDRYGFTEGDYQEHLQATKDRGYGIRIPSHRQGRLFDDGLAAIALPIYRDGAVYGAVSLLWPKAYLGHEAFARKYLANLEQTTRQISTDLEKLSPRESA